MEAGTENVRYCVALKAEIACSDGIAYSDGNSIGRIAIATVL